MVICHCRAISDALVRQAVEEGALDIEAVIRRCGAASACGGCRPAIAQLLGDLAPEVTLLGATPVAIARCSAA